MQFSVLLRLSWLAISFFILTTFLLASPGLETGSRQDSVTQQPRGLILIPAVYYTPETRIAGGAAAIVYFRKPSCAENRRPSTISPTLIYTQNNQIISGITTEIYLRQETYRIRGGLSYLKFPDKFFGIGPDTKQSQEEDFTQRKTNFDASAEKKLYSRFNVGLQFRVLDSELLKVDEKGLLVDGKVVGSAGGVISGAGILANRDTRDNIFYPVSGQYHQFYAMFYRDFSGSDYQFDTYILDLRHYFPLGNFRTLAAQVYIGKTTGDTPFQMLPGIGGSNLLRGYYEGRYRDKNLAALQTELRTRIKGRLGMAVFAGAGNVAPDFSGLKIAGLKYSLGLGLRYLFSRQEGLNVRIDMGFGRDSSGIYINLGEAF